ncbi:cyclase family protein [Hymenobacter sp. BT770]|uniref:cyclase family protein n=1 Tax=Hymenobacter sp. BT770 TaxID=2886942 RepID=UPI001D120ADE|nr:cyclase family protein [Hymenobacter sp. BT770]MCC3154164.1 cyclase family protein [Hymenobacter sp. BT770]MDO3414389.1 cyclase family protein [Hymenobacter sp. BT770]
MLPTYPYAGRTYSFDPDAPIDISLPLAPGKDQVNCFWAEAVQFDTIRVGSFVGSVAQGGSTNYQRVHVTPHGNGTHTECYGHISPDPAVTLNQCLRRFLFVARVVSVAPRPQPNGDQVVMLADVQAALATQPDRSMPEALVLRTLPNDPAKRHRQYSGTNPTYVEPALAEFLVEHGVQHFLLDLPSVDREEDAGQLLAHHAFWQYPAQPRYGATITELIFVPDDVVDGLYLLNIQITSLELDASPSKPVLYHLSLPSPA